MEFELSFSYFIQSGFSHILDVKAYDHLVFIITLCALYQIKEWRKVLVLVTAFTIGHSITLLTTTLGWRILSSNTIEILIPITIFLTAIYNIAIPKKEDTKISRKEDTKTFSKSISWNYLVALIFGFIHGMGFANGFGEMIAPLLDSQSQTIFYLFAFNLGIELGQILIVIFFFLILYVLSFFIKILAREWNLFISGMGAGISIILLIKILTGS